MPPKTDHSTRSAAPSMRSAAPSTRSAAPQTSAAEGMEWLRLRLHQEANKSSYRLWKQITSLVERAVAQINAKSRRAALLSLYQIYGVSKTIFHRNLMHMYGNIVLVDNPRDFINIIEEIYKKEQLLLFRVIHMSQARAYKIQCSSLLQCTVMGSSLKNVDVSTYNSPYIGEPVCYINTRYFLPVVYRWFSEQRVDAKEGLIYLLYIENKLAMKYEPTFEFKSNPHIAAHNKTIISALKDEVISGTPAGIVHMGWRDQLAYNMTVLSIDPQKTIERIHKAAKDKYEIFTHQLDQPALERHYSVAIVKDKASEKVVSNIYDYPRFCAIGYVEHDGRRYSDFFSTLTLLHLQGWMYERSGIQVASSYYGLARRLRDSKKTIPTKGTYGVYYGVSIWHAYKKASFADKL